MLRTLLKSQVLGAFLLAAVCCPCASAAEPAAFLAAIPKNSLVIARVARLDAIDAKLQPLAEKFGIPCPLFGKMLESIGGLDLSGDLVLGVALVGEAKYSPFVLLPVTDYRVFVEEADGDPTLASTSIALAGEELVATDRGRWALVTNSSETGSDMGRLDHETREALAPHIGREAVTLLLSPAGLAHLEKLANSCVQKGNEFARRRHRPARSQVNWKSLEYWRSTIALYQPVVSELQAETGGSVFAVDRSAEGGILLRIALLRKPRSSPIPASRQPASRLAKLQLDRPIVVASGPVGSGAAGSLWTGLVTQLYIRALSPSFDFDGVHALAPDELQQYCDSARAVGDAVQDASLLLIAPPVKKPTHSNAALLFRVSDATKFRELVDQVMSDWNRLTEKSPRRNRLVYESKPLAIEGRGGRRYQVDLPAAFGAAGNAQIRDLMAQMVGRNGVMVMDVVELDKHHVLISDLPDELRDRLIANFWDADNQPEVEDPSGGWQIDWNPALFQDWRNEVKKIRLGGSVMGWKPKRLESKSHIILRIPSDPEAVTLHAQIPRDVVDALAKWVDPKP